MNEIPKTKSGWRITRRIVLSLAIFATMIAIFYAEEDWRGKRAWENCKRELEAKGEVLDWNAYIPPPVPDDQNFFKAPKMQEWFVKNQSSLSNEFTARLRNTDTVATNLDEVASAKYLAWSDQFEPDFNLIRDALKRPYVRIDGDYSIPYKIPIPNFVAVRIVAQTLAQRTKCDLRLGQPEKALEELTLMHDMCRLLLAAPTSKPMTLVSAMMNVAVNGLYVSTVAEGFQSHIWQETQLAALQKQLAEIRLVPFVADALQTEPASVCHTAETMEFRKILNVATIVNSSSPPTLWQKVKNFKSYGYDLMPRGWVYQNMAFYARLIQRPIAAYQSAREIVQPKKIENAFPEIDKTLQHAPVFGMLATIGIPNFAKAAQAMAHNQILADEAQIVCALERYHLANGNYPETLAALLPQFIEKIPRDLIGGEPLHYRRSGGKFILYSVGWNETDDGGIKVDSGYPSTKGDWIW